MDQHRNFAYSIVAVPPSPALTGVTLTVAAGQGALFPTPPFNATVWPSSGVPQAWNAEIIRVTGKAGDTFSAITRQQEGSSARSIQAGDQIAATITTKAITDIEDFVNALPSGPGGAPGGMTSGRTYAKFTGLAAQGWSTPDAAKFDITTDVDLRGLVHPTNWAGGASQTIVGKWTESGNQRGYMLSIEATGKLLFNFSTTGTDNFQILSSVTIPSRVSYQGPLWVRVVATPNNGSGRAQCTFFYSYDYVVWVQLGAVVAHATAVGPWFSGTSPVYVGQKAAGTTPFNGRIYMAEIFDGGVLQGQFDARALASPLVAITASTGEVWTPLASAARAFDEINSIDFLDKTLIPQRVSPPEASEDGFLASIAGVTLWVSRAQPVTLGDYYGINPANTDNAPAINTALQGMATYGGTAKLPCLRNGNGVYNCLSPVIIPATVHMEGEGGYEFVSNLGTQLKAPVGWPSTTLTSGVTFPADTITSFTINVASTAGFPLGAGGITPPGNIAIACLGGRTFYYTGTTPTSFTGCTTNDIGAVIPNGATVSTFLVWLSEPAHVEQATDCYIRGIVVNPNNRGMAGGIWSSHVAEGSGVFHLHVIGVQNFAIRIEDPVRSGTTPGGIGGRPANWELNDLSISWGTAAHADAVAVDFLGMRFAIYGVGFIRGMHKISVGGLGGATAKADFRFNGCTGLYTVLHTESAVRGIIIGDRVRCAMALKDITYSRVSDTLIQLGAFTESISLEMVQKSDAGAPAGGILPGGAKLIDDVVIAESTTEQTLQKYVRGADGSVETDSKIILPRAGGPRRDKGYTTANLPSAATAGEGARAFDLTRHTPVWSDGGAWRAASTTPSGTSVFSTWRNVQDYGATGDGVTDDTAAIVLAIAALGLTTGSAGVLYFPTGIYRCSGALIGSATVGIRVRMVGDSEATTFLQPFTTGPILTVEGPGTTDSDYFSWEGIGLKTSGNLPYDQPLIQLRRLRNWRIDGVFLSATGTGTMFNLDTCYTGVVRKVWIPTSCKYFCPFDVNNTVAVQQEDTVRFENCSLGTNGPIIANAQGGRHGYEFDGLKVVNVSPEFGTFAESLLASGTSIGATTLTVTTGQGALFTAGDPVLIGTQNAFEVNRVNSISVDTLTLTQPMIHAHIATDPIIAKGYLCALGSNIHNVKFTRCHSEGFGPAIVAHTVQALKTESNFCGSREWIRLVGPVQDLEVLETTMNGSGGVSRVVHLPSWNTNANGTRWKILGPFPLPSGAIATTPLSDPGALAGARQTRVRTTPSGVSTETINIQTAGATFAERIYTVNGVEKFRQLYDGTLQWGGSAGPRLLAPATAAPTTGSYAQGDRLYNSQPEPGGNAGWICTAAGTPGTWKAFGVISE